MHYKSHQAYKSTQLWNPLCHTTHNAAVLLLLPLLLLQLHALGVPPGHFSHIMFDEAGHAEEPLALCALAGLSGSSTAVVLAGDPNQLGPVIHSRIAGVW
jgi:superfamily I DNA and/or RNA helicase